MTDLETLYLWAPILSRERPSTYNLHLSIVDIFDKLVISSSSPDAIFLVKRLHGLDKEYKLTSEPFPTTSGRMLLLNRCTTQNWFDYLYRSHKTGKRAGTSLTGWRDSMGNLLHWVMTMWFVCNVNILRKRRRYVNYLRADMDDFYSEVCLPAEFILTIYNALEAPSQYSIWSFQTPLWYLWSHRRMTPAITLVIHPTKWHRIIFVSARKACPSTMHSWLIWNHWVTCVWAVMIHEKKA